MTTLAQKLLAGDRAAAASLASGLLKPLPNNFVERPWGGVAIRGYKGLVALPEQAEIAGQGLGEAFEVSADRRDREAQEHPSRIELADGSRIALDVLLERHAAVLLGEGFARRYGPCFPLLPKTLDIKELLSVQGHPRGHTEAYVVISAEPGASLRLGFNRDVDGRALAAELEAGRQHQLALLAELPAGIDLLALQRSLGPWLAERRAKPARLHELLGRLAAPARLSWPSLEPRLLVLREHYWRMLDVLNTVPLAPGQIVYNATPPRLLGAGVEPAAEVHALGNPEGREVLMLEIRRPGPTLRAWDHLRFPIREIDIEGALGVLNLRRTEPEEFLVAPTPIAGRPGVWQCVASEQFDIERWRPVPGRALDVEPQAPHSVHAIAGEARLERAAGESLGVLRRGESAIVACGVGAYRVTSDSDATEIIKVGLPDRR